MRLSEARRSQKGNTNTLSRAREVYRLNKEELIEYREIDARDELTQYPTRDLTSKESIEYRLAYYEYMERLYRMFEETGDLQEGDSIRVNPHNGAVLIMEDWWEER